MISAQMEIAQIAHIHLLFTKVPVWLHVCLVADAGTNDKAGSPLYLTKFCSPQAIKTTHTPLKAWEYKYMQQA